EGGESPTGEEVTEESVLSLEVLAAAADLLRDRGVPLASESPFDSETDILLARIRIEPAASGDDDELRLVSTGQHAEETLQVLQALVDAFVASRMAAVSPANVPTGDWERERRQLVLAIERQERMITERVAQLRASGEVSGNDAQGSDDAALLESDLAEA